MCDQCDCHYERLRRRFGRVLGIAHRQRFDLFIAGARAIRAERERDEAAKRASDVTIECGRLEEQRDYWKQQAERPPNVLHLSGDPTDWMKALEIERDEALHRLSLVKREAHRWKQEFWNAWLALVELQRWEDRSEQVALDLLRERDDASRALDMERAAHWATVKRLEEAERDRDPELDVIRAWQALADADEGD
jgi:hypothetical protein